PASPRSAEHRLERHYAWSKCPLGRLSSGRVLIWIWWVRRSAAHNGAAALYVQRRSGGPLACRRAGHPARWNKLSNRPPVCGSAKSRAFFPGALLIRRDAPRYNQWRCPDVLPHFLNRKSFEFSSPHKMSSNSARRSFAPSRPGERLPNSAGVGARVRVPQKSSSRTSRLHLPLARSWLARFSFSDDNSFTVGPLIIWKAWAMLHSHDRSVSVVKSRGGLPKSSRNWSHWFARRLPLLSGRTPGNCAARRPTG